MAFIQVFCGKEMTFISTLLENIYNVETFEDRPQMYFKNKKTKPKSFSWLMISFWVSNAPREDIDIPQLGYRQTKKACNLRVALAIHDMWTGHQKKAEIILSVFDVTSSPSCITRNSWALKSAYNLWTLCTRDTKLLNFNKRPWSGNRMVTYNRSATLSNTSKVMKQVNSGSKIIKFRNCSSKGKVLTTTNRKSEVGLLIK